MMEPGVARAAMAVAEENKDFAGDVLQEQVTKEKLLSTEAGEGAELRGKCYFRD